MTWAIPLYTAWGIAVRLHVFFVIYIALTLLTSGINQSTMGVVFQAMAFASLFGIVLLHEYGHCFAAKRLGGEADQIILWPLGGLAMVNPPRTWRAHLITAAAGPMVNVALIPVIGIPLLLLTQNVQALAPNPLNLAASQAYVSLPSGAAPWWLAWLWWTHVVNLILLGFNVLMPMYPMDGGRIMQALLWRKMGLQKSMEISLTIGMVTAGVVGVLAIVVGAMVLLAIAILGGLVCYSEKKRLSFLGDAGEQDWRATNRAADAQSERAARAAERERERRLKARAEVERILDKIRDQGLHSLTKREKRVLENETDRQRGQ